MRAIKTKYLPATNLRSSKIKATSGKLSTTISYPSDKEGAECHAEAALELAKKQGWTGTLIAGGLDDGNYVFCFSDSQAFKIEAIHATL